MLSDIRTGLPGGADERDGGDGAAAFVFGPAPARSGRGGRPGHARPMSSWTGGASRAPRRRGFGRSASASTSTCRSPTPPSPMPSSRPASPPPTSTCWWWPARTVGPSRPSPGAGVARVADDLATTVGNAGTAQPGLLLANVLDQAEPGQTIAVVVLADGATALVLRTTDAIAQRTPGRDGGRPG